MAKMIGSQKNTGNYGEDFLCDNLTKAFGDDCIIYRNREVFGREFDVAMLIPNIGIVIFEAKGWLESSVIRVENGDVIVINTPEGEIKQSPQKQVRGYKFAIERRIRQGTGKFPLVFTMVCMPQITKEFYLSMHLNVVTEEHSTILKEDFSSKSALYEKINEAISNVSLFNRAPFDSVLMFKVRSLFEADLEMCDEILFEELPRIEIPKSTCYSLFYYIKANEPSIDTIIADISGKYALGCKIYSVVESPEYLKKLVMAINAILNEKRLIRKKDDLAIDYAGNHEHYPAYVDGVTSFSAFNFVASVLSSFESCFSIPTFSVVDGECAPQLSWLTLLSENSLFNLDQYLVEHADPEKGIIIRAGAGTGKTYTMISRISFVCYKQSIPIQNLADRIVMITFTNEAADLMDQRLKAYFQNYYFITANTDYLALVSKIDQMQISTIHSYVKTFISTLGTEFGYGVDVDITSTQYHRRKKVSDMLDEYIAKKRRDQGEGFISKLGMPVYALRDNIIEFISKLHNKSIDIKAIKAEDFGALSPDANGKELHELLAYIIPQVEKDYADELLAQNKVHLNSMMSLLNGYLHEHKSLKRIKELQKNRPQFMFVDEFQDTDDTQIEMLLIIASILEYKLFLVGDIKQCIYRFRGAKEKAFDQVHIEDNPGQWLEFTLRRNYRTDSRLLEIYDKSFAVWNSNDEILTYKPDDKLLGTKSFNEGIPINKFYKHIYIPNEDMRIAALFEEIKRIGKRIDYDHKNGRVLSAKERSIAILVRENWQADMIRKEGARADLTILTNTGGDLYQSTPALDMLVLVNALLHYDEADYLYSFVTSNFFSIEIPKSSLFIQRKQIRESGWRAKADEKSQTNFLIKAMNSLLSQSITDCKDWDALIKSIRLKPILQILREIYSTLKPWCNFSDDLWKQQYYKLNVDLLFEQVLSACNADRLTINTLGEYLFNAVVAKTSIDSRTPPTDQESAPIQCITVHKAKGLEYGHVILPFASFSLNTIKKADLHISTIYEKGRNRIGYSIKYGEDRDRIRNNYYNEDSEKSERSREETRILYVAMTRAIRSFSWISLEGKENLCWQTLIQREDS